MVLAANLSDYMFPWQLGVLALCLAAWLGGGTYLTRWALTRLTDLPKEKRSAKRAFQLNFLATGAGLVAAVVVAYAFVRLLRRVEGSKFAVAALGGVMALLAMLATAWAVGLVMLNLPAKKQAQITATTSGLLAVLLALLGTVTFAVSFKQRIRNAHLDGCKRSLSNLHDSLNRYSPTHLGGQSLEELVDKGMLSADMILCPSNPGRSPGYLYAPAPRVVDSISDRIRACDRRGNHGGTRMVLFTNGRVRQLSEREFAKLLELPENAPIAELDRADRR